MPFNMSIKRYVQNILEDPSQNLLENLRSKMINFFLSFLFFIITVVVTLSILRAVHTGWRPIYFFQMALLLILFVLFLKRRTISTRVKASLITSLFFLSAISGILNFGLISQSNGLFTMAVLISLIFLSFTTTIVILISSVAFLLTMTMLVSKGLYLFNLDFNAYAYAPTSWITVTIGFTLLLSLLVTSIGWLIYTLISLIESVKKNNDALHRSREELKYALSAKSEFLANMSHEIRTPMNAILGFVEQLSKSEKDPVRQSQFQIIQNSSHTLLAIINDILDLSKIESGKLQIEPTPCHTREAFNETLMLFQDQAEQKNVSLKGSLSPDFPDYLIIDATRVKQVIFNLLSNSIKFTPEGGSIYLDLSYDYSSNEMHASVTDTGIGITQASQEKIFEAFEQEDASTTRRFGGTGLGLSISKKLIELMHGSISVKSREGEGSSFSFSIPVRSIHSTDAIEAPDVPAAVEKLKGSVLVAEDNKTNQMLISLILEDLGLDYTIVNDGKEAVESAKRSHFDVILMDENMPVMHGIEATKQIRDLESGKKSRSVIIAVTANAFANAKERFIQAGMDEYIAKPYSEKAIKEILSRFLSRC